MVMSSAGVKRLAELRPGRRRLRPRYADRLIFVLGSRVGLEVASSSSAPETSVGKPSEPAPGIPSEIKERSGLRSFYRGPDGAFLQITGAIRPARDFARAPEASGATGISIAGQSMVRNCGRVGSSGGETGAVPQLIGLRMTELGLEA
jgi:hypothetical protein